MYSEVGTDKTTPIWYNIVMQNDLWQNLIHLRTLDAAWEKVRSNAGAAGGDGMSTMRFQTGAARRLTDLARKLDRNTFVPSPYRSLDIPKKKGGTRRLMIPSVKDRVVHTALAMVLTPVLDPQFEESSFAYRPGRSVKQAVQAIETWRKQGFWHVIEADIIGFFDAVRHDQLIDKLDAALAGLPGAQAVVALVAYLLEHQAQETGVMGKGVAQGSPLSPLLANLYLDALDETIQGRGIRLVRFADDFVVLCKKRKSAEAALLEVRECLAEHGLEMHPGGTRIVDFDRGFEFLGTLFVRSFALQQFSDPEEDMMSMLRDLGAEENKLAQKVQKDTRAGYDRGDRVLYLMERGRRLGLRNLSFAVTSSEGKELAAIAHSRVDRIEVGPGVDVDFAVLDHALATDTDLVIVNGRGEMRGQLVTPGSDQARLQLAQAKAVLDPGTQFQIACALVDARIRNQRTQLFRLNRRQDLPKVTAALASMGRHLRKLPKAETVDTLRGLEGVAAADYWPALGLLTKHAPCPFRRKRPATDPLNGAINYLTALLLRDVRAGVVAAGLHTGFGTLHAGRDRAEAMVYDMMEPFRAPLTEGIAAFLFNANRLRPDMFTSLGRTGIRMDQSARRALITGYEAALAKRVNVTGRSTKLAWRPMMRRQAQDLAGALRNDALADFQPYLMEP